MRYIFAFLITLAALTSLSWISNVQGAESSNPNIARSAMATASSEYSRDFSPSKAIDGQIAEPHSGDAGMAWAINGKQAKGKADFTLTWDTPVEVSEIVYFGRAGAGFIDEGFKDV